MTYNLAGLRIVSDFPLPAITPHRDEIVAGDKVILRRASVPKSLPSFDRVFSDGQCNKSEFLLIVPDVARYLIRNGAEILVDEAPNSFADDVVACLLGTAFGILCHQRGITPLHASVIEVANGYVAFVGPSGVGKSTMAAALKARGRQVVADDVCFLRLGPSGNVKTWPGINRLRLWGDSLEALDQRGPGVQRETRGSDKFLLPLAPRPHLEPSRLRRVYQLHAGAECANCMIPLLGAAAIEALIQNVYRLNLAEQMGLKSSTFVTCAALAREVSLFRFSRRMGFDALGDGVDFLQDHMNDIR